MTHGLFGKPTTVNNVETLANVPLILRDGGAAYAAIGTEGQHRPEAVLRLRRRRAARPLRGAVRGDAARACSRSPAACRGGRPLQAVLLGGAAGAFVGPDELDVALTFEGTRAAGATLGSGVVMVFDEDADLADTLLRIAAFFRDESCGQCVPCRVGTVRQEEALRAARARPAAGLARAGAGADPRDRPGDARRVDLRPRPDGVVGDRVGPAAPGHGGAVTTPTASRRTATRRPRDAPRRSDPASRSARSSSTRRRARRGSPSHRPSRNGAPVELTVDGDPGHRSPRATRSSTPAARRASTSRRSATSTR